MYDKIGVAFVTEADVEDLALKYEPDVPNGFELFKIDTGAFGAVAPALA